jgi:hypothetical protein
MQKWIHKRASVQYFDDLVKKAGKGNGWELVAVDDGYAYFKKAV